MNAIKRWYQGEYVPPENDPGSHAVILQGRQRYHWSARAGRYLATFLSDTLEMDLGISYCCRRLFCRA